MIKMVITGFPSMADGYAHPDAYLLKLLNLRNFSL